MLKLVDIVKDYPMKDQEPVHALKGLTINFRRNEFVAILGPSGCGKTTLLNIIGGLDRYTSGDLVIEGRSTKDYKDGDWDTYRNHSIGFVFQSYNLIPHQTLIKNVELALTIGGVSKEERKQRAIKALEKVGLGGLEKKKPNQLSGGQMQRVAIARALINEPEILLADEPTGALDSETSIQVMDLLKEVSKDCLVIMVTHNPDLAEAYANRIIKMKDGLTLSDSNPYSDEQENLDHKKEEIKPVEKSSKGHKKRSSMSFITATGLSLSNLLSKLKRTVLVAIAGSIGIIGISAVLAVSNGVRGFINDMQDDMLSQYPLAIAEEAIDYSSLMSGLTSDDKQKIAKIDMSDEVAVDSMINYLMDKYKDFTSVKSNDINKELIQFIHDMPSNYYDSISMNYGLDMTNNIFTKWNRSSTPGEAKDKMMSLNGLTQMYISELRTVSGFGEYAYFVDLFTDFMKQLPGDEKYILSQYDLIGQNSHYPTSPNEIVLVVDEEQTLTDFVLAQLGFFTEDQFLNIARRAIKENEDGYDELSEEEKQAIRDKYYYPDKYDIDDILGKELIYYPHDSIWNYQTITRKTVTASISLGGEVFEMTLVYNNQTDTLEGDLKTSGTSLVITFDRLGTKDESNVILGTWSTTVLDMPFIFTADSSNQIYMNSYPVGTYTVEDKQTTGFMYNAEVQDDWLGGEKIKISGILKKKSGVNFGSLSRGVYYTPELTKKMMADSIHSQIVDDPTRGIKSNITYGSDNEEFKAYVTYTYTSFRKGDDAPIYDIDGYANALNTDLSSSISSMFSFGMSSSIDTDKAHLRSLCGLSTKLKTTALGTYYYDFEELPQEISIYPVDFKLKDKIKTYLDKWNSEETITLSNGVNLKAEDRDELTYEDTISLIVMVINTLINVITVALVSFTSLSLVVSCFMIAVITYISTMERVKEIGVIRSLGGRKKDVSRLFIAECLIIGLASGLIGVGITYVIQLIINIIVTALGVGVTMIANLPILTALIMIGLSIALNVLSGLIPSTKASHQDPVVALRSE